MTKREMLIAIKNDLVANSDAITDCAEKVEFLEAQIAQLDAKATKAKERAAEKKAVGDELREAIYNTLTSEPMTIPEIASTFDDETVTEARVRARLSQLVQADRIAKEKVKTESGEKMGYFILADAAL